MRNVPQLIDVGGIKTTIQNAWHDSFHFNSLIELLMVFKDSEKKLCRLAPR